jgi:eukaryotic-like serine/threonine-protein kinase
MLTPDTILQGRYRIVRQLGQGGMGAVYEAIDERLDTTVALKETLFTDERLRRQFEREARLLARLHHPALPRVSDHFSEGEGQFLVMQYIAGQDLAEMMTARQGAFPASQVLTWADQLLDALDYLHTQEPQIIHRDIKPQNLKLTSRGQIILLDFGLAKGQGGDISRITAAASIFGYTPNYAPLEQIQGLGTDPRSDLYALAATLYHLLTGVKPPDALTRAAALVNGQADPLLPPSETNRAVDPAIDQVMKRALAQNRDQRFSSAADMRKALLAKDQVATIRDRAEAQTVLFPPTAAPTVASATDVIEKQPTVATGETTVVRPAALIGSSRRGLPWALSIAALVLVAAGVLGFVALKWRRAPVDVVNPTPVESPTVAPTATPVETVAETRTPEPSKPQPSAEARKTEKAESRKPAPKPSVEADEEEETEQHDTQVHPEPAVPDVPPPTNLPRRPTTKVLPGGVVIRTLPDGTQILTAPDGTRVLTTPDGRRQVIKPRVYRRRTSPQP